MSYRSISENFDDNSYKYNSLLDLQYGYVKGRYRKKNKRSRECRTKNSIKYDIYVNGKMKSPHTFVSPNNWRRTQCSKLNEQEWPDGDEILNLKDRKSVKKYMKRFVNNDSCLFTVYFNGFKGNHRKTFLGMWDSRLKKHLAKEYKQYRRWTQSYDEDLVVESRDSYLTRKKILKEKNIHHGNDTCCICMSSMHKKVVTTTRCNHIFCKSCFDLLAKYNSMEDYRERHTLKCPLCRSKIS